MSQGVGTARATDRSSASIVSYGCTKADLTGWDNCMIASTPSCQTPTTSFELQRLPQARSEVIVKSPLLCHEYKVPRHVGKCGYAHTALDMVTSPSIFQTYRTRMGSIQGFPGCYARLFVTPTTCRAHHPIAIYAMCSTTCI